MNNSAIDYGNECYRLLWQMQEIIKMLEKASEDTKVYNISFTEKALSAMQEVIHKTGNEKLDGITIDDPTGKYKEDFEEFFEENKDRDIPVGGVFVTLEDGREMLVFPDAIKEDILDFDTIEREKLGLDERSVEIANAIKSYENISQNSLGDKINITGFDVNLAEYIKSDIEASGGEILAFRNDLSEPIITATFPSGVEYDVHNAFAKGRQFGRTTGASHQADITLLNSKGYEEGRDYFISNKQIFPKPGCESFEEIKTLLTENTQNKHFIRPHLVDKYEAALKEAKIPYVRDDNDIDAKNGNIVFLIGKENKKEVDIISSHIEFDGKNKREAEKITFLGRAAAEKGNAELKSNNLELHFDIYKTKDTIKDILTKNCKFTEEKANFIINNEQSHSVHQIVEGKIATLDKKNMDSCLKEIAAVALRPKDLSNSAYDYNATRQLISELQDKNFNAERLSDKNKELYSALSVEEKETIKTICKSVVVQDPRKIHLNGERSREFAEMLNKNEISKDVKEKDISEQLR